MGPSVPFGEPQSATIWFEETLRGIPYSGL
jgi:hypothetical protein